MTVKPFSYYDLVEIFSQPGCAICHLLLRDVDRYLDALLYEYNNDPQTHQTFRAGRGLCNEHSGQLARFKGTVLGTAILYEAALDEVLKIVEVTPMTTPSSLSQWFGKLSNTSSGSSLADALEPGGPCLVCDTLARSEQIYLRSFVDHITDPALEQAYRSSTGICLPHFRHALREAHEPAQQETLISIQKGHWERLKAELGEFTRKYDINHAGEAMGAEGDSWQRAIRQLAGERGVFR